MFYYIIVWTLRSRNSLAVKEIIDYLHAIFAMEHNKELDKL